MSRKILLVEPNYKNKYPPIGLMKIATYHRLLGDNVRFFKGDLRDLVVDELAQLCILKLAKIDEAAEWRQKSGLIKEYIKNKKSEILDQLLIGKLKYRNLALQCLVNFADIYRKKLYIKELKWDRIYVTTLFTFYWKITIQTIEFLKPFVKQDQLLVGGVMASLLHKEIEEATGIKTHQGLLDTPGMLDPQNLKAQEIVIDDLPLDYSILDEIEYQYPTQSAYFTFMTKGCTRKCAFCSVPILEPTYKPKIETKDKFFEIKKKFGEQQHLLLMDNNVLASPKFLDIIEEIKEMGFYKGATFVEPNQLDIAIKNLKSRSKSNNTKAYVKRSHFLLNDLLFRLKGSDKQNLYNILENYNLLLLETATKENLLIVYEIVKELFEKNRNLTPKLRYVDFNQGTDARYVTDEIMRKMSEIPIKPLRLAFDYIGIKEKYINAVRLAAKYDILELSNYILYNFNDSPEDLYNRLDINVKLNEELGTKIFSFPMKYIPLFGEDAKGREYVGKKWNKKYIRAVQSILNVTKGIVAPGRNFFSKAFGKNVEEFKELLYMPETYIIYRHYFEESGLTAMWKDIFRSLTEEEKMIVLPLIESNDFRNIEQYSLNSKLKGLINHYTIKKESVDQRDIEFRRIKSQFKKLIKEDRFIDLTLTYDFEQDQPRKLHKARV